MSTLPAQRPYIIDGLNVCRYRRTKPSLRPLLTLVLELVHRDSRFICLFDAVTRYRLPESEREQYDILLDRLPDYFVEITGGIEADDFILLQADSTGSDVVSNDRYRKYFSQYPWLQAGERLIKGSIVGQALLLPGLGISVPLHRGVEAMIGQLAARLNPLISSTPEETSLHRNSTSSSLSKRARYREIVRRAEIEDVRSGL